MTRTEPQRAVCSSSSSTVSRVYYVKTEGETRPVPQLYMDCKIKVSLNIQHAVQ